MKPGQSLPANRGSIVSVYQNRDLKHVAILKWTHGSGPQQLVSDEPLRMDGSVYLDANGQVKPMIFGRPTNHD